MLSHEKLHETIDCISKELCESIDGFHKNKTWTSLQDVERLTQLLLNLKCLCHQVHEDCDSDSVEPVETMEHTHHHKSVPTTKETVKNSFTMKEAENWVSHLETKLPDGSVVKGGHWTLDQTNVVAKQKGVVWEHIQPHHFWVTMNMMYSDYLIVASKHGVDTVDFYFDLTRAFLFDVDSVPPKDKLCAYYYYIVKPAIK